MPQDAPPAEFVSDLARLDDPKAIAAYLKERHGRINQPSALTSPTATDLLRRNTALVDSVLQRLFEISIVRAQDGGLAGEGAPSLAIVATGGYGRRELAPFSDVNVTFVPSREDDAFLNAVIKNMFQIMMDVFMYGANLKVGYAYRLLGDLNQLDHQTQTALLDARLLCGDEELFKEFRSQFRAHLLTGDFLFQKWAERQAVVQKFGGDEVYSVEPNVKEGAGCLRDIQSAEWIAGVRYHVGPRQLWHALVEEKIISEEDAANVLRGRDFFFRVRCALHVVSGDARETLTSEKQEAVANLLAYPETQEVPAVESFMRDFYVHASENRRIARKAMKLCLDSEIPLGLGLVSRNRGIAIADFAQASRDAAMPLHVAEFAQAYDLELDGAIEDDLRRFREKYPEPGDTVLCGRVFTRILASGRRVSETLNRLQDLKVLGWLLPEFQAIMNLIPYDAAHEYTVGSHSLKVVRNLEKLKCTNDPKLLEYKRISGEVSLPEVLYLAGLLHDIGKQWPEGHHEETGAEAARRIAARIGWDKERTDKLVFLVRHHLRMAETSRLRDLALEETVQEFAKLIPDIDSLNMLYLLTYADTTAVGAGVWTEVHGRFLSELYGRAEAMLQTVSEDGSPPAFVPDLARQRERIRKQLAQHDLPVDLIHEHTRDLPAQYLLNTPLEEMYLHIAMIGRLRVTYKPIIDFRTEYGAEYTELTICAYDDPKPGLLAKIMGVLYAHDINLHLAQVFTRSTSVRIALDTLWVDFRGKPLSTTKKAELQSSLHKVLTGELWVPDLLESRNKPIKQQTIYSAKIDDKISERMSLLEVSAPDEKGVGYRLCRAISEMGWNIHAARLSVWGSRARDAFYITDVESRRVSAGDVERFCTSLPVVSYSRRARMANPQ